MFTLHEKENIVTDENRKKQSALYLLSELKRAFPLHHLISRSLGPSKCYIMPTLYVCMFVCTYAYDGIHL